MVDLSKKTALVVDSGLYTHVAEKLAQSFGKTLYFAEWRGQFPTSKWARIGEGLDGIERVKSLWDNVDRADVVIFLDIYASDIQRHLRSAGHRVWGNGDAEQLELNRWWVKNFLKMTDAAVNEFEQIQGIDDLIRHVKNKKDLWIKGGPYRGDFESFHYENLWLSKPWFDELRHTLGPTQNTYDFLVESPIPGVEVGFDGFSVDGEFPSVAAFGYEAKDAGYLGKAFEAGELPIPLQQVNQSIQQILRGTSARGFLSLEMRIGKDRTPYLLDPCLRCGSPPSEVLMELFSNWAEVIWEGAGGTLVDLAPVAKYAAQIVLKSDWCKENWLAIDIDAESAAATKLHNHCKIDGVDYVVPTGITEIGGIVAVADTLAGAIEACYARAKGVKAYQLEYNEEAFNDCLTYIEEGKEYGISW